jgi:hypothetical protein
MCNTIEWLEESSMRYYMAQFLRQMRIDAAARIAAALSSRVKIKRMLVQCFRLIHLDRAAPMFR